MRFSQHVRAFASSCFIILTLFLLASCRNESGEEAFVAAVQVAQKDVQSIQIQTGKQGDVLEASAQSQFLVFATLADQTIEDVTASVSWSTSDANIFTVSKAGLVTAGAIDGTADLAVTWSYLSASLPVSVSTAPLTALGFSGLAASVSECQAGIPFSIQGTYGDGRTSDVTGLVSAWDSSNTSVARISAAGILDTLDAGSVTLEASYGGETASQALSVTDSLTALSLEPSVSVEIETGASRAFVVEATEPTETREVTSIATFNIASPGLLTVDDAGLATAGSTPGSTTLSASCGGLSTSDVTVTVVQPKTATELVIRYNNAGTSPAGPFDTSDSPIQLQAILRYNDGSEVDVTDDEYTDWSVRSTVSGTAATVDNDGADKGEVSFSQVGRTEIEAVYDDDVNNVYKEDTIDVLVE